MTATSDSPALISRAATEIPALPPPMMTVLWCEFREGMGPPLGPQRKLRMYVHLSLAAAGCQ